MLVVLSVLHSLRFLVRSRASLHVEIVVLRHQLAVVKRSRRQRLRLTSVDRMLWAWLSQRWHGWRSALHVVQPATVLAWRRRGFRLLALNKDTPCPRAVTPPSAGRVVAIPQVGGLHHRYDRIAA